MLRIGRKPEETGNPASTNPTATNPTATSPATSTPVTSSSTATSSTGTSSAGKAPEEKAAVQSPTVASSGEPNAVDIKGESLNGYVGKGTSFVGEVTFQAMLRVDGTLSGQVKSENGILIVGTMGKVDANIRVGTAIINGTVKGDMFASGKVELGKTAQMIGNIETPCLKIEEGALFEGKCTMLKASEPSQKGPATTASTMVRREPGTEPTKSS